MFIFIANCNADVDSEVIWTLYTETHLCYIWKFYYVQ